MARANGSKNGGLDSSKDVMFQSETFLSGHGLVHEMPDVCPCDSVDGGPKVIAMQQWEEDE